MANAFGTLMNHGVHMAPRFILETKDVNGEVISRAPKKPKPQNVALKPEIADQVVKAMSGVTKPGGTAKAAAQEFLVYGKTGTTNDSVDAWFIGCAYSPQNICIATWMGYEDQNCKGIGNGACGGMLGVHGVPQVYGGTLPAQDLHPQLPDPARDPGQPARGTAGHRALDRPDGPGLADRGRPACRDQGAAPTQPLAASAGGRHDGAEPGRAQSAAAGEPGAAPTAGPGAVPDPAAARVLAERLPPEERVTTVGDCGGGRCRLADLRRARRSSGPGG